MKKLLPLVSLVGLALVTAPACLYVAGVTDKPEVKTWMLVGTVIWFLSAPLWIGRNEGDKA